ncbi:MAG: type II secretion system protein [Phycisphaerae bacterium]|nr:type II secretion system protein [Phycisphaerae bacterium]
MSGIHHNAQRSEQRAFTLVELLVVVAIIALLVSILLPTLNRAKESARMVKCLANLHAIGTAANMYAAYNNDYVPRDADDLTPGYYYFGARFSPYLGGPEVPLEYDAPTADSAYMYDVFKELPVYQCPSFQDKRFVLTYLSNGRNLEPTGWIESPASKVTKLPRPPAEIAYICEINFACSEFNPEPNSVDYQFYDFWSNDLTWYGLQLTFSDSGATNPDPRMIHGDDERHLGRTTMTFFDGHAESRRLTPEELPTELFFPEY